MTLNALKPLAAALAVAGVATPLFLQHQALAAARDQNASLGAQVAELDELRAENERLGKLAVDFRELERLRAEHLELMRLRGEATLMRNELDALKREFERHRQLLLAKGVSEEELLTEAERQARRQIVIEPRFAELPLSSTVWTEFGLRPPTNANDEGGYQVLDTEAAARLIKRLEETKGVDIMFAPRVTTLSGRQTQIKPVDVQMVVTDQSSGELTFEAEQMEYGSMLDVIPTLDPDGKMLHLGTVVTVNQFLGYDDAGAFVNQVSGRQEEALVMPRVNVRQFQADAHLAPGQVLVMTGGYLPGAITKSEGNIEQAEPKGLIVIVNALEIDKSGNTVNP